MLVIGNMIAPVFSKGPPPPPAPQPARYELQPATALQTPTPIERGVVWHPAGQPYLVYQNFSGGPARLYDWTNGIPTRWQLIPTVRSDGVYHLIWQNDDGSLWRAQINRNGERVLASIEVARNADDFTATTTRIGQTVLLWTIETDTFGTVLDGFGRPLQQLTNISDVFDAPHLIDIQSSGDRQLNLSWLDSSNRLHYGTTVDMVDFSAIRTIQPDLAPGEWLDRLLIVVTAQDTYTLWTIADIERPATQRLHALAWSTGEIITLLDNTPVRGIAPAGSLGPGFVLPIVTTTIQTDSGWQGAIFNLETNNLTLLDTPDIINAAPNLWFDLQGTPQSFAWSTFDTRGEVLHIATSPILRIPEPVILPDTQTWLKDGLSELYRGLVWLGVTALIWLAASVLPGPVVMYRLEALVALAAYVVVRIVFPVDLFGTPEPLLESVSASSTTAAGVLLTVSSTAALLSAVIFLPWQRGFIAGFFVLDTILCFMIFGANL